MVEGADGDMVKLKLAYYNFWKFMRSISHEKICKAIMEVTSNEHIKYRWQTGNRY